MRKLISEGWEQFEKYIMKFMAIGCVLLITACGTKESDTAIGKTGAVSDSAIVEKGDAETVSDSAIVEKGETEAVSGSAIDKKDTEDIRVEFVIHDKNSHAVMGVTLPKGWNYSFVGSAHEDISQDNKLLCIGEQSTNEDLEEYGICFWNEENPDMKMKYLYHKDRLLFCGTGVTIRKETLDNAGTPLKAESLMEQIQNDIWYTLILDRTKLIRGDKGDYAVQCEAEKKLWNKYQKEIKEILEGITLQKCR